MLTPDSFRATAATLAQDARRKRLAFPADEVPPQQIFLLNAMGDVMQLLIVGEPIRKAPAVVERAIVRHGAVAAALIAEAWMREVPADAPRFRGNFADMPDSEEVLLCFLTWPQAGVSDVRPFSMIRSAFGTLDLVPREIPPGGSLGHSWLTELLPQPVSV